MLVIKIIFIELKIYYRKVIRYWYKVSYGKKNIKEYFLLLRRDGSILFLLLLVWGILGVIYFYGIKFIFVYCMFGVFFMRGLFGSWRISYFLGNVLS